MRTPLRLTFLSSMCCDLFKNVRSVARRVASSTIPALGVLLFLGNDGVCRVCAAPPESSPSVPQSSAPISPSTPPQTSRHLPNRRLESSETREKSLAIQLAQLEFQFQETQKIGSERLDEVTKRVAVLLDDARKLAKQMESNAELAEQAEAFVSQLEDFQRFIESGSDFFKNLAQLDAASLNPKATRSFFDSFAPSSTVSSSATPYFNSVSDSSNSFAESLAACRAELNRAAESLDALSSLETWNEFVETRGSDLERFYVAPETAEKALAFISQNERFQGLPQEFQTLKRRAVEWRFTALNRVAIQRKILLALEAELATKYWTFAATPDKIYYLPQPPFPGRNVCFADSNGALASVDVPADAPETATADATQLLFIKELAKEARSIPESLRVDDVARWYAAWSAFLTRLQTTDKLDPLVQFRLLQKVAQTLSDGDFYFAQRLTPTLRLLNVPRLNPVGAFDIFQTESEATQELRRLAKTRVNFLPTNRLTVDKTTAQLDAQTERFAFVYRQIGWLDRDFSGAWRCRRPANAPLPIGDLYVLLPTQSAPNALKQATYSRDAVVSASEILESDAASTPRFRWLKIGSSDGRQMSLEFAAPDVCRGAIVLCRSRVGTSNPVAKRNDLERVLLR